MSVYTLPTPERLWERSGQVLTDEQALVTAEVVTELVRYRKHFPFVHFRRRRWASFDNVGIWEPDHANDHGTMYAHLDTHAWIQPLADAVDIVRQMRPPDNAYDPSFMSFLALKPGEYFPPHQDFGMPHRRSITALRGHAIVELVDISRGISEEFVHGPGEEYAMWITDDELTSTMHSVRVVSEGSRLNMTY